MNALTNNVRVQTLGGQQQPPLYRVEIDGRTVLASDVSIEMVPGSTPVVRVTLPLAEVDLDLQADLRLEILPGLGGAA